jgi:hypothetical protein
LSDDNLVDKVATTVLINLKEVVIPANEHPLFKSEHGKRMSRKIVSEK